MCMPQSQQQQQPAPSLAIPPGPAPLGSGMANNAALAIAGRKRSLEDAIKKAGG